jgi:L-aspartate oxidase
VSELIVRSALARKESRGLHYTLDYPQMNTDLVDTVLTPPEFGLTPSVIRHEATEQN